MTIFKWISKPSDEILGSESEEINNSNLKDCRKMLKEYKSASRLTRYRNKLSKTNIKVEFSKEINKSTKNEKKPRKLFLNQFIQALQITNTATEEEEKQSNEIKSDNIASMKTFDKNILVRVNKSSHQKRMNIFTPEPRKTEYILCPKDERRETLYKL